MVAKPAECSECKRADTRFPHDLCPGINCGCGCLNSTRWMHVHVRLPNCPLPSRVLHPAATPRRMSRRDVRHALAAEWETVKRARAARDFTTELGAMERIDELLDLYPSAA